MAKKSLIWPNLKSLLTIFQVERQDIMPMWKPIVRYVANSVQHRVWTYTLVLELLSGKEYV